MATQDDYIRTALRVPPDLHSRIHDAAKSNNRTFNAEIVARLEQSFSSPVHPEDLPSFIRDELAKLVDQKLSGARVLLDPGNGLQAAELVIQPPKTPSNKSPS